MKKAIVHVDVNDTDYIQITECEEKEVKKTIEDLIKFGSKIVIVVDADRVPEIEAIVAKNGGGPVGLT